MDWEEYRTNGKLFKKVLCIVYCVISLIAKCVIDFICDYMLTIREKQVFPSVQPGYMRQLMDQTAPLESEPWDKIFDDFNQIVMPGITHWQSPHMHAYFPALNSPASLLGDMLADAIGCLGFTWASSPACTELETIVMDWLAQLLGLPCEFLHSNRDTTGGGVIQTTSSEATFIALLAARTKAIKKFKESNRAARDSDVNTRLVAYCSDQAHSSVEKAGLIGLVRMRYIESDEKFSMRGNELVRVIHEDKADGLVPFFVCATLGTTGCCAFDNLREIGNIAREENLWLHVDAAYAGTAFICPEYRHWLNGVELVDSFAFNPSKWMMVHFDCTAMWVKDSNALHRTFNVEPLYLQHENSGHAIDYMHWQIPLSKKFRALKLWFVIRNFGVKGLQEHIRKSVRLANYFRQLVEADRRFEIPAETFLGLVVFRLKGQNELTEKLLKKLNSDGRLHCVPASLHGTYVIRFTVTSPLTNDKDIERDWRIIKETATYILEQFGLTTGVGLPRLPLKEIKRKAPDFGTSLLLSHSPMTPKVINGSFVAIFDQTDMIQDFVRSTPNIRLVSKDSPALRRRIKGMMVSEKQYR